jgi:hypothetical protein
LYADPLYQSPLLQHCSMIAGRKQQIISEGMQHAIPGVCIGLTAV